LNRRNKCSSVVVGMAVLLLGVPGACTAQKETSTVVAALYRYDTVGVRLEGTLIERKEYGPPGYGETPAKDEKDTILVLKLSSPITVQPTANAEVSGSASLDTVKDVHELQLYIPQSKVADVRKLIGKIVVAVGTLNEAAAPSQYTKVWMDTQSVDLK
jgi:hypothetical protein